MCIASAWTPGPRFPRAPTRAPQIELSRLNPRSATSSAPTTTTGGGFAVGCVLQGNGTGPVDGGGLLECSLTSMLAPPPTLNSPRLGPRLRDLHEDAHLRTPRRAEGFQSVSTTRAPSGLTSLNLTSTPHEGGIIQRGVHEARQNFGRNGTIAR